MPEYYLIETTNHCNLQCRLCSNKDMTRKREHMSLNNFNKILKEISPYAKKIGFDLGGEPLLNSETPEMIKATTKKNISSTLTTNAHFLNEKIIPKLFEAGLKKIVISLGGITKESYEFYHHKGNFDLAKKISKSYVLKKNKENQNIPLLKFHF